jgi:hypothetical protein
VGGGVGDYWTSLVALQPGSVVGIVKRSWAGITRNSCYLTHSRDVWCEGGARIFLDNWLIGIQFPAEGRDASEHLLGLPSLLSEDTGGFFSADMKRPGLVADHFTSI